MSTENRKGINTCDMITTLRIPMMEMNAIDFNAGCCAKINTPNPAMVVMAERKMDENRVAHGQGIGR